MFDTIIDFDPKYAADSVSHGIINCVESTIEQACEVEIIVVGIADGESNIITDYDPDYKLS